MGCAGRESQVHSGLGIYIWKHKAVHSSQAQLIGRGLNGSQWRCSLWKKTMRKNQLLFSLDVIMALTDDISIEQVLFPARLIYALVHGLLPSAVMGQPQWTCSWP